LHQLREATVLTDSISIHNGRLVVPDQPTIPFIEGDGTGPDIWRATKKVLDEAVAISYGGQRGIEWVEILAGEKGYKETGEWLPEETLEAIKSHVVAIKGPLTTPVGGGFRSINVTLRQTLDLYACVRPVRWFNGVPSPVVNPEKVNMVVFRENMEDVYSGIEWKSGSPEARRLIEFLQEELGARVVPDSGIGIKPISRFNTERLVRRAVSYAIEHKRRSVTFVHKGNIMKYTEGAFKDWAYSYAEATFPDRVIREEGLPKEVSSNDKVVLKDRIADNMLQQVLMRPDEYDIIATPNLNGDYISDALAAQVGGIGMAPGANIGDTAAVFEATHGSAPKYANLNRANPCSLILSGIMMLEHLGWVEASEVTISALERTFSQGIFTADLARLTPGAVPVGTQEFADAVVGSMEGS
jgi:isocitrate dehydrogenase